MAVTQLDLKQAVKMESLRVEDLYPPNMFKKEDDVYAYEKEDLGITESASYENFDVNGGAMCEPKIIAEDVFTLHLESGSTVSVQNKITC